jgi:hypothetical protein
MAVLVVLEEHQTVLAVLVVLTATEQIEVVLVQAELVVLVEVVAEVVPHPLVPLAHPLLALLVSPTVATEEMDNQLAV